MKSNTLLSRRRALSTLAAIFCSSPSLLHAARGGTGSWTGSCIETSEFGWSGTNGGNELEYEWTTMLGLRKKMKINIPDDPDKGSFASDKALDAVRPLSREENERNYLKMTMDDPYKDTLIRTVARHLVSKAVEEDRDPILDIVAFVQSIPHQCEGAGNQKWPTEVLMFYSADCSSKTTLACALLEQCGLSDGLPPGCAPDSMGPPALPTGRIPLWAMFRHDDVWRPEYEKPNKGHLTLGLNERALARSACSHLALHHQLEGRRHHLVIGGDRYYYTELNGFPGRMPGEIPDGFRKGGWGLIRHPEIR